MRMNNLWAEARCLLLAGAVCAGLAACSDDHNDEPRPDGLEEIVTHIESVVNSHLDELYGNESLDELLLPVENDAEAQKVVKEFIREEWNGQDYTYRVPGDYGRIHIRKDSQEGLYYTMMFSINDHKPFTFRLCTPGYPESENAPQGLQHVSGSWQLDSASDTDLLGCYDGTEKEAKMGDFFYSDGTYSDGGLRKLYTDGSYKTDNTVLPDPEKTCIGIVFYVGQHGTDQANYTSTGIGQAQCHGYVVALTDVNNGSSDRLRWEYGPGNVYNQRVNASTSSSDWQGYSNSLKFHEFVDDETNKKNGWEMKHFPAALACETYGKRTADQNGNSTNAYDWQQPLAAPKNTSGWFLPSCGQLSYLYQNSSLLSSRMTEVKNNTPAGCSYKDYIKWFSISYYYWSSAEYSYYPNYACYVDFYDGLAGNYYKNCDGFVRAVLAF